MVGIGIAMLGLVACSWFVWRRNAWSDARWFLRLCEIASPLGFFAVIAGWVTTEVGRQPWVVYGLMRTRDAVTPSLSVGDVIASLAVYIIAYVMIFGAGGYFMLRFLRAGPEPRPPVPEHHPVATPARPLSAATEVE